MLANKLAMAFITSTQQISRNNLELKCLFLLHEDHNMKKGSSHSFLFQQEYKVHFGAGWIYMSQNKTFQYTAVKIFHNDNGQ